MQPEALCAAKGTACATDPPVGPQGALVQPGNILRGQAPVAAPLPPLALQPSIVFIFCGGRGKQATQNMASCRAAG